MRVTWQIEIIRSKECESKIWQDSLILPTDSWVVTYIDQSRRSNVPHKRADHTSGLIKTRARRAFHFLLLAKQQCRVTMSSNTEGRISLALQALTSNQIKSFRAAASAYDVLFATLRARHLGIPLRADAPANSRKLTNDEEQILIQKVLQLLADGFPP